MAYINPAKKHTSVINAEKAFKIDPAFTHLTIAVGKDCTLQVKPLGFPDFIDITDGSLTANSLTTFILPVVESIKVVPNVAENCVVTWGQF